MPDDPTTSVKLLTEVLSLKQQLEGSKRSISVPYVGRTNTRTGQRQANTAATIRKDKSTS